MRPYTPTGGEMKEILNIDIKMSLICIICEIVQFYIWQWKVGEYKNYFMEKKTSNWKILTFPSNAASIVP